MSTKIVAVVTVGGVARASDARVVSRHGGMAAARARAVKERNCGRDAIAEWADEFLAAGGSIPGYVITTPRDGVIPGVASRRKGACTFRRRDLH